MNNGRQVRSARQRGSWGFGVEVVGVDLSVG